MDSNNNIDGTNYFIGLDLYLSLIGCKILKPKKALWIVQIIARTVTIPFGFLVHGLLSYISYYLVLETDFRVDRRGAGCR